MRFCRTALLAFTVTVLITFSVQAQETQKKTFNYGLEITGMASSDETQPFWFYNNKRGTVDPDSPGGLATLHFQKHIMDRSGFDYGFGATFVKRFSEDEAFFFPQLYGRLSYGAFQLSGGRFFEHTGSVNESLSMGSLAISPNATPLPKIKFGIPEYTPIPLTNRFVEVKGSIAHGWFEEDRVVEKAWLHEKSAYIRFGGDFAFKPYAGLIHQVTWAGETDTGGDIGDSFADFMNVFFALSGSEDAPVSDQIYKQGDHRGVWDFGFNLSLSNVHINVYRQFIYNDKDGLKLQNPEDGLLGVGIEMPSDDPSLITGFLWEYLYTKNQSGPLCPRNERDEVGGCDDYYNNSFYRSGWTYKGKTIGNPLFLPVNAPGITQPSFDAGITNNRIVAHHFGLEGDLSSTVAYKLLATWSRNYGVYDNIRLYQNPGPTDFNSVPEQWSVLAKFSYQPAAFRSLELNASFAGDFGELYKDRVGIMLGIKLMGTSPF